MTRIFRYASVLGALVAVGAAAIAIQSARRARSLVHPSRTPVASEATRRAFEQVGGLEDVSFRTADGLALRGWFAPGSRRAVVIFVHGLWGNRLTLLPEARILAKHGYGVLLYDSRASGESEGDLATWGDREQLDARAAVDYVSSRAEVDANRIVLLGFSVGASTAALAVAHDPRPRALILYATWSSLEEEMKHKFGRYGPLSWVPAIFAMRQAGVVLDNVRPIDHLSAVHPRPLLMITGTLDDDTPVPVMERLFQVAGEPKELWVVPRANHGGYLAAAPAEYEARVVSFLDRALFGAAAQTSGP